jgi:hypothetical protein
MTVLSVLIFEQKNPNVHVLVNEDFTDVETFVQTCVDRLCRLSVKFNGTQFYIQNRKLSGWEIGTMRREGLHVVPGESLDDFLRRHTKLFF